MWRNVDSPGISAPNTFRPWARVGSGEIPESPLVGSPAQLVDHLDLLAEVLPQV
jgi:hypothetical protein